MGRRPPGGAYSASQAPYLVGRGSLPPPQNLTPAFSPLGFGLRASALRASQLRAPNLLLNQDPQSLATPLLALALWAKSFTVSFRSVWNSLWYKCRCAELLNTFGHILKNELSGPCLCSKHEHSAKFVPLCASDSLAIYVQLHKCVSNHCLEWYISEYSTNLYHSRQWS